MLHEILEPHGDVEIIDVAAPTTRYIRLRASAPGYGLPHAATYDYEEWYRRWRREWVLTAFQYELRFQPAPRGRFGYHWHDGVHHVHCDEGQPSGPGDHYLGYAVDLVPHAHPSLSRMFASGRIDCTGLLRV